MMHLRPIQVFLSATLAGLVLPGLLAGCVTSEQHVAKTQLTYTQEPVLDPRLTKEDFAFPSRPPRLSNGQKVFAQNCAVCHSVGKMSYDKIRDVRPIDEYLLLTRGDKGHPAFGLDSKTALDRDARWEALFYYRYLAGEGHFQTADYGTLASLFGSNCAVCHGKRGQADGTLYSGNGGHDLGMSPVKGSFDPPPANFTSYSRMYNRTNNQELRYLVQGIYPSAMPSWYGRSDKDKHVVFNEAVLTDLVKYVRSFGYENDLSEDQKAKMTFGTPGKLGQYPPLDKSLSESPSAASEKKTP